MDTKAELVASKLSPASQAVFAFLPGNIKSQLLLDRDPHGNVQVAKIETEKLLAETVAVELEKLQTQGKYSGKFNAQFHAFGYEGRSGLPSQFDATYCYVLGQNVASLISFGQNGLISSVTNLTADVSEWSCGGVPITMMCNMEKRHSHMKPVIKKALVELDGEPFKCFESQRKDWAKYDLYRSPGSIQFGDSSLDLSITLTLELKKYDVRMSTDDFEAYKNLQDNLPVSRIGKFFISPKPKFRLSAVQEARTQSKPKICSVFSKNLQGIVKGDKRADIVTLDSSSDASLSGKSFGVLFCGRQAPGGHDIINGLFDSITRSNSSNTLYGFIGGSSGLVNGNYIQITEEILANYRGQGGYDLIGRYADEFSGDNIFKKCLETCSKLNIEYLVLIGGTRTCTDAHKFARVAKEMNANLTIVAAPADINCPLKSSSLNTTVGFDTFTKVCAQIVGNNASDGRSAKKYYYFMRIMGQQSSQTTLEVALSTKPNYAILTEEVIAFQMTLADIISSITDVITARAAIGKNYGTVLIPEGLILAIPEMKGLIQSIDKAHATLAMNSTPVALELIKAQLPSWNRALLESLPSFIVEQLLLERSTDGSLQCAQVETERLLAYFVEEELKNRKANGNYSGATSVVNQFLGYQIRGSMPTIFDSTLAYNTGITAAALCASGCSGYLASMHNVSAPVSDWKPSGLSIESLLQTMPNALKLGDEIKAVPTAMVDLKSLSYKKFSSQRNSWATADDYENPGPIQYSGPASEIGCILLEKGTFDFI